MGIRGPHGVTNIQQSIWGGQMGCQGDPLGVTGSPGGVTGASWSVTGAPRGQGCSMRGPGGAIIFFGFKSALKPVKPAQFSYAGVRTHCLPFGPC